MNDLIVTKIVIDRYPTGFYYLIGYNSTGETIYHLSFDSMKEVLANLLMKL